MRHGRGCRTGPHRSQRLPKKGLRKTLQKSPADLDMFY